MTVASATAKSGPYTGNGSQTVFAYGFKIFANTELQIIRTSVAGSDTTLALGSDYTVSGVGADAGGNVTTTVAPATGEKITILRNVALTQLVDLRNQGGFYPEVHERAFDKLTMAVQKLDEEIERSVKVSPSASASPDDLLASIAASETNAAASATSASESAATAVSAVATVGVPALGVYTGNGSQTVFTLPATPPSTNAIMVFVGGVHQERTKFSFSGTTLTFVTAPPDGAPIQVVIGAPLNSTTFTNTVGTNEMQDNAATNAKLADMAGNTVKVRAAGTTGDPSDLALAASQLLGRGATGNVAALALGANLSMSGTTINATPTLATPVATTSGTAIDFTGILSTARMIAVMFNGVSLSGTASHRIQLGDSGGVETTGYVGTVGVRSGEVNLSAGFDLDFATAATAVSGALILTCLDATNNIWTAFGIFAADGSGQSPRFIAGRKQLSATLDRVRITSSNGTDTFDAGSANILYL